MPTVYFFVMLIGTCAYHEEILKKYFGLFGVGHPLWGLPHSNHLGIIE